MKYFYVLILSVIIHHAAKAQRLALKGSVMQENGRSVEGATITLQRIADPTSAISTASAGRSFHFTSLPGGEYKLEVSAVGFEVFRSGTFLLKNDSTLAAITLVPLPQNLSEVKITYVKPPVEERGGKTVVNVAGSINAAGSTAFEILQRAPGVNLDDNGSVRLNGKEGVQLMIDGKLQPLTGDDLAAFLKSIPAGTIDKVELTRNPPSRYDASGKAGVIEIRTKKNMQDGWNGSINVSFLQGKYSKGSSGVNLSYKKGKVNLTSAYSLIRRNEFAELDISRQFFPDGSESTALKQDNIFHHKGLIHSGQIGLDYRLSAETTFGITGSAYLNDNTRYADNLSTILNTNEQPVSKFTTAGISAYHRVNPALNFSLKQSLDGSANLAVNLDYANYQTDNRQDYNTSFADLNGSPLKVPYVLHGDLEGYLSIQSAKADYMTSLKGFFTGLEAGLKSSRVKSDNNLAFFDRSNGNNIPDTASSNHFLYDENINSAYASLQHSGKQFSIQGGLRLENTNATGKQFVGDLTDKRSYTQLFPNITLDYKVNEKHSLGLSLSRRIDRPTYRQLNPFRYYLNESTYQSGNPGLRPQLSWSAELSHTILDQYNFKYGYSRTNDYIISVIAPDPQLKNVVVESDQNLAVLNYYSISFSAPVNIGKWYKAYYNVLGYYNRFDGGLAGTPIRSGMATLQLTANNTFNISPDVTAEVTGTYKSRELYGLLNVSPIWTLGAGVQKQLLAKRASIKVSVSDIFLTNKFRDVNQTKGYREAFVQTTDSRVLTLSFNYRFGNALQSKKNATGADEEKQRAN